MPLSPQTLALLDRLRQSQKMTKTPNVSESTGTFLYDLVQKRGAKHILELGTANGVSTIYLASAIQDQKDAHIITIESDRRIYQEAVDNLAAFDAQVTLVCADASRYLASLSTFRFDLIYIDALKSATLAHYLGVLSLLVPGGMIVVDDVVKFRSKMEDFYEYLDSHGIKYQIHMTDPDDGVMVIQDPRG